MLLPTTGVKAKASSTFELGRLRDARGLTIDDGGRGCCCARVGLESLMEMSLIGRIRESVATLTL